MPSVSQSGQSGEGAGCGGGEDGAAKRTSHRAARSAALRLILPPVVAVCMSVPLAAEVGALRCLGSPCAGQCLKLLRVGDRRIESLIKSHVIDTLVNFIGSDDQSGC